MAEWNEGQAFLFFFEKWRGSRAVQRMSFAERGMFLEMLIEQWIRETLPDDAGAVAEALATSDAQVAEVQAAWPILRRKFEPAEGEAGRIVNLTLEKVRRNRRAWLQKQKSAGRKGGEERARRARQRQEAQEDKALGGPQGLVKQASSRIKPLELSRDEVKGKEGSGGDARGRRPIFTGSRFAVFEWQLDSLSRLLGPHFETFGLDEFFFALDTRAAESGQVIPQRDGGQWLQAQVMAEAQRRGLAIAAATIPKAGPRSNVPGAEETRRYLQRQSEPAR